jgi:hypothetical protein
MRWLDEIERLDPVRDCRRIVFIDTFIEFPFDTTRALELAFFKTFAVPSIAEILDSTGEFVQRGQKRYDDTDILISAFSEDGWDGDVGKRAIRRLNQIHGRFPIANDDYVYVLSALVLEPLRYNERFGWRRKTETERRAQFEFWKEIGRRMAIRDIPATLEEIDEYNRDYERTRYARTDAGVRLAEAQRDVFLAWLPWVPKALGARAISALLEPHVVDALGLVRPTQAERRATEAAQLSGRMDRRDARPRSSCEKLRTPWPTKSR